MKINSGQVYKIRIKNKDLSNRTLEYIEKIKELPKEQYENIISINDDYVDLGPFLCLRDTLDSDPYGCFVCIYNKDNTYQTLSRIFLKYGACIFNKCNSAILYYIGNNNLNFYIFYSRLDKKEIEVIRISKHSKPAKMLINKIIDVKYIFDFQGKTNKTFKILNRKTNKITKNKVCVCVKSVRIKK